MPSPKMPHLSAPLRREDRELLTKVKAHVTRLIPGVRVILYGSRARGEATVESDYDLLILTPNAVSIAEKERLNSLLYEVELEHKVVLSSLVYDLAAWEDRAMRATPLRQIIEREGVML